MVEILALTLGSNFKVVTLLFALPVNVTSLYISSISGASPNKAIPTIFGTFNEHTYTINCRNFTSISRRLRVWLGLANHMFGVALFIACA